METTKMNKVFFLSLGCPKNTVDTENMTLLTETAGFEIAETAEEADFIVINTCAFILDAKTESVDAILSAAELLKTAPNKKIVVTGCLAQRYAAELTEEIPEVSLFLGTGDMFDIAKHLLALKEEEKCAARQKAYTEKLNDAVPEAGRTLTGEGYAYIKLSEGCNKNCSYCIIPSLRGHQRDREFSAIVDEAKQLIESGVTELVLIAQDTGEYGTQLYKKRMLPELITAIDALPGLVWLRLLYVYPETVSDELISALANGKHTLHYIDIPLQHISDPILKAMNRKTKKADIIRVVEKLRRAMPDIAIRSSFIAGFPGEKMSDVHDLSDFLQDAKLTRVGVFAFSPEEGTPAEKMKEQISDAEKAERTEYLMQVQRDVSEEIMLRFVGKTLSVVVEAFEGEEENKLVYSARSYLDAPEIDGCVYVYSDKELNIGEYINVKITDSMEYDLFAVAE